jgi:hypothetical protein
VNKEASMQFMGFESKLAVREYTFTVREASNVPREFTITIALEAFNVRRVRFQDGPDVCALKLRRELAAHENHPPENHFHVTDAELEEYRSSHTPRRRSVFSPRPAEDY